MSAPTPMPNETPTQKPAIGTLEWEMANLATSKPAVTDLTEEQGKRADELMRVIDGNETPTELPTPRTDACFANARDDEEAGHNLFAEAKKLERELAVANAKLLRNESDVYLCELEQSRAECLKLRAEVDALTLGLETTDAVAILMLRKAEAECLKRGDEIARLRAALGTSSGLLAFLHGAFADQIKSMDSVLLKAAHEANRIALSATPEPAKQVNWERVADMIADHSGFVIVKDDSTQEGDKLVYHGDFGVTLRPSESGGSFQLAVDCIAALAKLVTNDDGIDPEAFHIELTREEANLIKTVASFAKSSGEPAKHADTELIDWWEEHCDSGIVWFSNGAWRVHSHEKAFGYFRDAIIAARKGAT